LKARVDDIAKVCPVTLSLQVCVVLLNP
jgi:hypothetical protein